MARSDISVARASTSTFVAFAGSSRVKEGSLAEVAAAALKAGVEAPGSAVLVFDRETGAVVDLDLRGGEEEVRGRYGGKQAPAMQRGRPRIGVVSREVTLLPRHWEWLARQPGGASTTLRRLVETAQRSDAAIMRARTEAAYRFMSAIAGDTAGFEEASRALFAGDLARLSGLTSAWPRDVRDEVLLLAGDKTAG